VEGVLPFCQDGISQRVCDVFGCNVFDAVTPPDGWNRGVVVSSRVGLDPTNDGSSCPDWAQCYVARCHLSCCVVLLILFLHLEGYLETVKVFKGWIVVVDKPSAFNILTQMHGKEEGKNGELQDCALELCQFLLGDLGNDAGRGGF
jgi:hypothetical protein